MNKKNFFRDYTYLMIIISLLWSELSQIDTLVVNFIKHVGFTILYFSMFIIGLLIDNYMNKEESFIKSKLNTFNVLIFLCVILIILNIKFHFI